MDWLSDTIARIRNALLNKRRSVIVRGTKLVVDTLNVMHSEGFLESYEPVDSSRLRQALVVNFSYKDSLPVIRGINRLSSPGLRKYVASCDLVPYIKKFSVPIVSTSSGVVSGKTAIKSNLGGELLCEVF